MGCPPRWVVQVLSVPHQVPGGSGGCGCGPVASDRWRLDYRHSAAPKWCNLRPRHFAADAQSPVPDGWKIWTDSSIDTTSTRGSEVASFAYWNAADLAHRLAEEAVPVTHKPNPAALLPESAPSHLFAREAQVAIEIALRIKNSNPDIRSWVNFPLINATGDQDDLVIQPYSGSAQRTMFATRLPVVVGFMDILRGLGLDISHARIAVLLRRDVLRPHIDTHRTIRVIVPLNDQGTDFRHVLGPVAVAMQLGDIWLVNGRVCHGAANISDRGHRAALLIDARPGTSSFPPSNSFGWKIPHDRIVRRRRWDNEARRESHRRFYSVLHSRGAEAAENEWHFMPFEFSMPPHLAYQELVKLCSEVAESQPSPAQAAWWTERASFWMKNNCQCVPSRSQ